MAEAFFYELGDGLVNVGIGVGNFVTDTFDFLVLGGIDLVVEFNLLQLQLLTGVDIHWTPLSSYGQASQQAVEAGQLEEHYWNLGLNAVTVGGYGFYQTWLEYQRTGDPTAMQQYAGSWFAGAVCGKFAQDYGATPISLPKRARNPLGGQKIRAPQQQTIEPFDGRVHHNAPKVGGRRGNQATRDHIDQVRDDFLEANPEYQHVAGGRDQLTGAELPEEYLPPLDGGRRGSSYPDLTFQGPDGGRVRINTTDTRVDGTMTPREQANFDRIFEQTYGEPVIAIPKPRPGS